MVQLEKLNDQYKSNPYPTTEEKAHIFDYHYQAFGEASQFWFRIERARRERHYCTSKVVKEGVDKVKN